MPDPTPDVPSLSEEELRRLSQTLPMPPARNDQLLSRLGYIADLLADAGKLPRQPVLVWREVGGAVRYAAIGRQLVVGRLADRSDLRLPEDRLLSRTHFVIRVAGETWELEDLNSRNGTAVNAPNNRIQRKLLRDGDLILAGQHVFAFLDQRRTS